MSGKTMRKFAVEASDREWMVLDVTDANPVMLCWCPNLADAEFVKAKFEERAYYSSGA